MAGRTILTGKRKPVPSTPRAKRKIATTLGEFKEGTLRSSTGAKVTSRQQAIAIALSKARERKKA